MVFLAFLVFKQSARAGREETGTLAKRVAAVRAAIDSPCAHSPYLLWRAVTTYFQINSGKLAYRLQLPVEYWGNLFDCPEELGTLVENHE